jgi:dTDP-4-dehydrorhamnose reductase
MATMELNARLPHRLARLAAATGGRLIHVSTDCVFSGTTGGYSESDPPDPVDLYGRSKVLGEPSGDGILSLRTSIVGHELASRQGLVEWFLAQAGPVTGYRRAIFSGMPTVVLADVLARVVLPRPDLGGLYHLSSAPISKLELLELVAQRYDCRAELQPSDEPAIDRSLDSSRFRTATGWQPPSWPELVDAMAADARTRYGERFSASPRR